MMQLLLDRVVDVSIVHNQGRIVLINTSQSGHLQIVEKLVTKGADVRIRRQNGWIALHAAANSEHAIVAERLIVQWADIDAVDADNI